MTRILVVDDMAVFREPIAAALRGQGFEVICAENGQQALDQIRRERPDVVLLDVAMPVMDGLQVLQALNEQPRMPMSRIILLTAVSERDYVIRAGQLGIKHYLLKSQFSLQQLIERINKLLCTDDDEHVQGGKQQETHEPPPAVPEHAGQQNVDPLQDSDDPVVQLKQMSSLVRKSDVIEKLDETAELRAFSPVVTRLLQLTNSEKSSIQNIVKTVKQDQGIALRILKLANSAVYTRGEPVDSIDEAVKRIGLSQIRQAVLNIGVIEAMSTVMIGDRVDAGQYWEHSIACGLIASEIARNSDPESADIAFTMGLMHDVGRIMLSECYPAEYCQAMDAAQKLGVPLEQVETRLFMLNHADCVDRLLHRWKFPKELIDPIVFHHLSIGNIRRVAPRRLEEVATLALADRLTHALMLGSTGNSMLYPTDDFCDALKLTSELLAKIEETARDETTSLRVAMLRASSDGNAWEDRREHYRELAGPDARPLYVSKSIDFDSFAVFLRQLEQPSDGPPNVAVAYVPKATDAVMIATRLQREEEQRKLSCLPTIVLTTDPTKLPSSEFKGRAVSVLRVPTPSHVLASEVGRMSCAVAQAA